MPRSRSSTGLAAYCTAVLATGLAAQERRPLVGRVIDAAGAPLARATVTLAWSPPGGEECGPGDVVTAATDERGRFVARVFGREGYSVWAVQATPGGEPRASIVHNHVAAGTDVELRVEHAAPCTGIVLEGAEPYADLGPLRVQVAPRAANLAWFDLAANDVTPLLPSIGLIVVRDRQGDVLCARTLPDGHRGPLTVKLPPPQTIDLRIAGPERKPVASAIVLHASASLSTLLRLETPFEPAPIEAWRRCGRSDDAGLARVTFVPRGSPGLQFLIRAPGMAEHITVLPATGGPIDVVLQPAGRLQLVSSGEPLAAGEVMFTASYRGATSFERATPLRLEGKGLVELPLPVQPVEAMLHVRTRPAGPWHLHRIPVSSGVTASVELADHRLLSLQFLDADGGPARGMAGIVMAVGSRFANCQQVPVCTDQAGRLERMLGPDAWVLFLTDGVRWARYDVPRRDAPDGVKEFRDTVKCQELPVARVRVFDAARREPVAGAWLLATGHATMSPPAPEDKAGGLLEAVMQKLGPRLLLGARSDAQGLLVVRTPPRSKLTFGVQIGAPGHGTSKVDLVPDAEGTALLPPAPVVQGSR